MATYTTLRRGSKGDDVKKLQTALGFTGNDLDGIYGPKTESAVTNYQKSKGLKVDGIAGNETLGSLYGTTPATSTTTPTTPNNVTETKDGDVVQQANSAIQQHIDANKKSPWSDTLNDTINRILNGEKFSYDLNGDTLYQQYKDQYTTQGQMAMMDTMGQAAAMTGGYGNSYAQNVGQQVYQGYLQQLNDRVPELYQLALNQYNQEQQGLQDQASILAALDQQHIDNYYTELGYLTGERDTAYNNQQNEKTSERELVLSLLGIGVMPDSASLDMAGISSAEAQAIIKQVEEQKKATAGFTKGTTTNRVAKTLDAGVKDVPDVPDDTPVYEETAAVNNFIAKIRTPHEFARGGSDKEKYKTYKDYVKGMLEEYESTLTDDEIATIVAMYGLNK